MDEPLFTHGRIKVYVERDCALRSHEYAVIVHARDGEEVGAFTFYVSDNSGQLTMGPFIEASKLGAVLGR